MTKVISCQLFIVGVGRSGTSLLQSMLNAHPRIAFTPEIHFVRRFLAKTELEMRWKQNPDFLFELFQKDDFLQRLDFEEKDIKEIIKTLRSNFSAIALYLGIQRRHAAKAGRGDIQWFGDKDPRSIEYLPTLSRLFPDMHVLHVMRDPRDVLASKKKAAWSRNAPALRHIFANRVQLKMGRRQGPRLFGKRYLEFTYESLITKPEEQLSRICTFLNLDFDPAMLDFGQSSRKLVSDKEMQWKKETLGPLLSSNFGKWPGSLDPWEAVLTERVCGEAMKVGQYTYSNRQDELNALGRMKCALWTAVVDLADPLYRLKGNWSQSS